MKGLSEPSGTGDSKGSKPLFDPVAGMRAVAEIQADGLRAASELLERMLGPDREIPQPRSRPPDRDYTALLETWAELLQRVAAGLAQPSAPGTVTVPVDSRGGGPAVRLVVERSEHSESTVAEIWLHNGTSLAVGPLALRCGALTGANGAVLDHARVLFDPGEISQLPPRSSRAVLASLVASDRPRSGIYRGTIQVDGAADLWLPLEVAIEPC